MAPCARANSSARRVAAISASKVETGWSRSGGTYRSAAAWITNRNVPSGNGKLAASPDWRVTAGSSAKCGERAWNAAGLLLGMMFSARFGDDSLRHGLCGQIER